MIRIIAPAERDADELPEYVEVDVLESLDVHTPGPLGVVSEPGEQSGAVW